MPGRSGRSCPAANVFRIEQFLIVRERGHYGQHRHPEVVMPAKRPGRIYDWRVGVEKETAPAVGGEAELQSSTRAESEHNITVGLLEFCVNAVEGARQGVFRYPMPHSVPIVDLNRHGPFRSRDHDCRREIPERRNNRRLTTIVRADEDVELVHAEMVVG
jgi:hypothetical protein